MTALGYRRLTQMDEFDACVALQQETWQYSAGELLPRRVFFLADRLGGHVLGAFDGESLVGFNLGMAAQRDGEAYIHSQMLAVLPAHRNSGAGRALKRMQRDIVLQQGIRRIEWTFDPLEIKNSFFNLCRLGAISRRYLQDFYGPSTSPLQGGLPTDRLCAEWWIDSPHVHRVLAEERDASAVTATVRVPADIYTWKQTRDERARSAQLRIREELQQYLERGLCVIGYRREEDGSGTFLLGDEPPRASGRT